MQGREQAIEFAHGYTYSGHPLASAACIATLEVYAETGLLTRAAALASHWENALHSLKGLPHVIDIRNIGLIGAIELEPRGGTGPARAQRFLEAFKLGLLVRATGDIIALAPPLIIDQHQIDELIAIVERVLSKQEAV